MKVMTVLTHSIHQSLSSVRGFFNTRFFLAAVGVDVDVDVVVVDDDELLVVLLLVPLVVLLLCVLRLDDDGGVVVADARCVARVGVPLLLLPFGIVLSDDVGEVRGRFFADDDDDTDADDDDVDDGVVGVGVDVVVARPDDLVFGVDDEDGNDVVGAVLVVDDNPDRAVDAVERAGVFFSFDDDDEVSDDVEAGVR